MVMIKEHGKGDRDCEMVMGMMTVMPSWSWSCDDMISASMLAHHMMAEFFVCTPDENLNSTSPDAIYTAPRS